MPKKIGLTQLAAKKYVLVDKLSYRMQRCIGVPEDAFDMLIHGDSNNGKSSAIAQLVIDLIKALDCRAEYVAWEEAHGRTVQATMIDRYRMHEEIPNKLVIADRYTYAELDKEMAKRQSAKLWIFDSLQASSLSADQYFNLKTKYVKSKRRKIFIVISWSNGSKPMGADAIAINYMADIKNYVKNLVMFSKSRFGGGEPFIIHLETAIRRCGGEKAFYKFIGQKPPKSTNSKPKNQKANGITPEAGNNSQRGTN